MELRAIRRVGNGARRLGRQLRNSRCTCSGQPDEVGGGQVEVGERDGRVLPSAATSASSRPATGPRQCANPASKRRFDADHGELAASAQPPVGAGVGGEHDRDAVGHCRTGARRAHHVELGWRGQPAIDIAERVHRRREVAPGEVVDLLGLQQIGRGVDGDTEPAQDAGGTSAKVRVLATADEVVDRVVLAVRPQTVEGEAVESAGGNG